MPANINSFMEWSLPQEMKIRGHWASLQYWSAHHCSHDLSASVDKLEIPHPCLSVSLELKLSDDWFSFSNSANDEENDGLCHSKWINCVLILTLYSHVLPYIDYTVQTKFYFPYGYRSGHPHFTYKTAGWNIMQIKDCHNRWRDKMTWILPSQKIWIGSSTLKLVAEDPLHMLSWVCAGDNHQASAGSGHIKHDFTNQDQFCLPLWKWEHATKNLSINLTCSYHMSFFF